MNKLNYLILDTIGVDFVPNIKNIHKEAQNLYSVRKVKKYKGIIKPVGSIRIGKIKSKKDEIIRVLLSLVTQENSQDTIISKLNSQDRHIALKKALIEYNKIYHSKHILRIINNPLLRVAMQTARNRTESYHQMQKIIRTMYHGVFKGKRVIDHKITTQAIRFTTNAIVAYNAIILNDIYLEMLENKADQATIDKFLRISPMAWSHVGLTGKYTFIKKKSEEVTIESSVEILKKELGKSKIT